MGGRRVRGEYYINLISITLVDILVTYFQSQSLHYCILHMLVLLYG